MFELMWTESAYKTFVKLEKAAEKTRLIRESQEKKKSSVQEGLYNQIVKTLNFLQQNPRYPSLETHQYYSLEHPWSKKEKVFEANVQNNISAAFRVFWCYGPKKKQITIIAITQHP